MSNRKVALIGGGGVRTPLVIFGINESAAHLGVDEMVLYDLDQDRAEVMCKLGQALIAREGGTLKLRVASTLEDAIAGAAFVLTAIRVGGIKARAIDERISIDNGYPGQETTGPGGIAMGLRTAAVAIEYARLIERLSPDAWMINFTNPAGLITQAISHHSKVRVIGICDTPTELFHRIALALGARPDEVHCEYVGLNHLGWVRRVLHRGEDVTARLLADDNALLSLYQARLFDFDLLRSLRLIPTEYLFFYYSRSRALANQRSAGATRGEEIGKLNEELFLKLATAVNDGRPDGALATYVDYLNQRSGSYMQLEATAGTAFDKTHSLTEDPFRVATGYHRIALDVMNALCSDEPRRVVINVRNDGAISDVAYEDIVEAPCAISRHAIVPEKCGELPEDVRGLVLAVKAYERAAIEAAVTGSQEYARKAMLLYPAIGEWEPSADLLRDFANKSPDFPVLTPKGTGTDQGSRQR
jgi:6-phospho-beta-glucosidase